MGLPKEGFFDLKPIADELVSNLVPVAMAEKHPTPDHLQDQLKCSKRLAELISRLHTPQETDNFLRDELTGYNYGEDLSAEGIAEQLIGNCFDTDMFITLTRYLHGDSPRIVLILADNTDVHHNLVVYRDRETGLLGSLGMSKHRELMGKIPRFQSVRHLIESYYPDYTSDDERYPGHQSMIGFTQPINIMGAFDPVKFITQEGIKDIYNNYLKGVSYGYSVSQRTDLPPHLPVPQGDDNVVVNGKEIGLTLF